MVRRLLLDAVLPRRERRQRQGDLRRFGQLHERRRHRHQHRFLPLYVPRQHLLQDHQEPYGRYDLRLLGDQRQRDPFERHRQLLDDSGPRHVHARHPPRLPRRRPARSGHQQYDHLGGMVRPLPAAPRPTSTSSGTLSTACRLSPRSPTTTPTRTATSIWPATPSARPARPTKGGRRPTA